MQEYRQAAAEHRPVLYVNGAYDIDDDDHELEVPNSSPHGMPLPLHDLLEFRHPRLTTNYHKNVVV